MSRHDDPNWYQTMWRWLRRNAAAVSALATVAGVIIGIVQR